MRQVFTYPLLFLVSLLFTGPGCVSHKAVGDVSVQYGDPNFRSVVKNAHFEKKFSPLAISVMGAGAGLGGYLGYNSNLTGSYRDGSRTTSKPANAAIGALAGFGISYLINTAIRGKEGPVYLTSPGDANKWLRKSKRGDHRIIDFSYDYSDFRIIPRSLESRFLFSNRQDFADFYNAFGKLSRYFDPNVYKSLKALSWDDLYWLYYDSAKNFLSSGTVAALEDAMLAKAYTIAQFGKTAQAVGRLKDKARESAFGKAKTINDYRDFASYFPEWREDASRRAFNLISRAYDVENFINGFPEKQVDALKKATGLSLSQDEQNRLGQFSGKHAQSLPAYGTRTFYLFLPAYSFGIATVNDVTAGPLQVSVSDAEILSSLAPSLCSFTLHESFLSVVDPFSYPRVLKIDITNPGSENLEVCLHIVQNDFSRRLLIQSWDEAALLLIPESWTKTRALVNILSLSIEFIEFVNQTREQKIKSAIVKGLAYLLKERYDLGEAGSISVDVLADYLLDFTDHVHIK